MPASCSCPCRGGGHERLLITGHGLPEDRLRELGAHPGEDGFWTIATPNDAPDVCRQAESAELDFRTLCGAEHQLAAALTGPHDGPLPTMRVGFLRQTGRGAFGDAARQLFHFLVPHFRLALVTFWESAASLRARLASQAAIDKLGHGLVVLGHDGMVLFANPKADAMLAAADGLQLRHGRLAAPAHDSQALASLLEQAANGVEGSIMLQRLSGKVPYTLMAWPLAESDHLAGIAGLPAVGLLIIDAAQCPPMLGVRAFARAHQLTPAEAHVLELMLQEQSPGQISARLELSIHTVRCHLSRIYAKTDTQNQRELITRFLRAAHP
jgi:DNA-binding CsgD family transcriptional regulator